MSGQTHELHNDGRKTLVKIGEKLYELTPSTVTLEQVKKAPPEQAPHVRQLNPIPMRSKEEQLKKNKESASLHKLHQEVVPNRHKTKSMEDVANNGEDIETTIQKLLVEKKEAKKSGDKKLMRSLRRQLRRLDYKRYLHK